MLDDNRMANATGALCLVGLRAPARCSDQRLDRLNADRTRVS